MWAFLGVLQYLARLGVHADFLRDATALDVERIPKPASTAFALQLFIRDLARMRFKAIDRAWLMLILASFDSFWPATARRPGRAEERQPG
jgi:hypothetical protein